MSDNAKAVEAQILDADAQLNFPLTGVQLIEASAGTGKTYTIANLYLKAILNGYDVSEVLLVTFTTAATDELRGRIRERIHEAVSMVSALGTKLKVEDTDIPSNSWLTNLNSDAFLASLLSFDKEQQKQQALQRLVLAGRSMDESSIFTIHSFCQRALQDFAFYSGQAYEQEMVSDEQVYTNAVHDWWRKRFYALPVEHATQLQAILGSPKTIVKSIRILESRDGVQLFQIDKGFTVEQYSEKLNVERLKLRERLNRTPEAFQDLLTSILKPIDKSNAGTLKQHEGKIESAEGMHLFIQTLKNWIESDNAPLCEILNEALDKKDSNGSLGRWPRGSNKDVREFFSELLAFRVQATEWMKLGEIAAAREWVIQEVESIKQQQGLWSFDDQLKKLDSALKNKVLGQKLAEKLRTRFPLAMIDEFQDTDPVQYRIFSCLYYGQKDYGLTMIGDPKQAIYSFRGGDIDTYMNARNQADQHWTLDTNWRSCPQIIDNVNALFSLKSDSLHYEGMAFSPVNSAPFTGSNHKQLVVGGVQQTGLHLWANDDAINKDSVVGDVHALVEPAIASKITELLHHGKIGDKPVKPSDIAILVNKHKEATRLKKALSAVGINASVKGGQNIWQTEEAKSLYTILTAIAQPANSTLSRKAYASFLFLRDIEQIYSEISDADVWGVWMASMHRWHDVWHTKGFIIMFQDFLEHSSLLKQLQHNDQVERCLTNLLHLAELVQKQAQLQSGIELLLKWYSENIQDEDNNSEKDEQALRLESDADLIQIVTVHSSKGLEYPIVFLPYAWDMKTFHYAECIWHEEEQLYYDISGQSAGKVKFEHEDLSERVRLAYVALTRAAAACWIVYGDFKGADKTPFSWLLGPPDSMREVGSSFCEKGVFCSVGEIPVTAAERMTTKDSDNALSLAPFTRDMQRNWRIQSFSGMIRDLPRHRSVYTETLDSTPYSLRFVAGAKPGTFLHAVYEKISFQDLNETQWQNQLELWCNRLAPRYGLKDLDLPNLALWVKDTLCAKLEPQSFSLNDIAEKQRLPELEFDFSAQQVNVQSLNNLLRKMNKPYLDACKEILEDIPMHAFQGRVNGIIDLVFEQEGRYYLADYKSNLLGRSMPDYQNDNMQKAILDRRYDLQYLIYSLALHRYLKLRIPDYSYQQHFGGVYYLFLRGMSPAETAGNGVFFTKVDETIMDEVDALFGFEELL